MQDEEILKISLITTVIGLLGLIVTSSFVSIDTIDISDIDNSKLDEEVEINGIIDSVYITKSNTTIIEVSDDTGSINVVVFASTHLNTTVSKNMKVSITGTVSIYNGDYELILENPSDFCVI